MLLRNKLAVARKKLTKLELQDEVGTDQRGVGEAAVPEWAETNGHGAGIAATQESHVSGCGYGCGLGVTICGVLDFQGVICESSKEHVLRPPAGGGRQTFPTTASGGAGKRPQSLRYL